MQNMPYRTITEANFSSMLMTWSKRTWKKRLSNAFHIFRSSNRSWSSWWSFVRQYTTCAKCFNPTKDGVSGRNGSFRWILKWRRNLCCTAVIVIISDKTVVRENTVLNRPRLHNFNWQQNARNSRVERDTLHLSRTNREIVLAVLKTSVLVPNPVQVILKSKPNTL